MSRKELIKMNKLNINNEVSVRLTSYGEHIWNSAKIEIDDIYEKRQYEVLYSGLLSKTTVNLQEVANFIEQDFTRVFPNRFLELDPNGKNQSMYYFDMLIRSEHFNVCLWMETANPLFKIYTPTFSVEGGVIASGHDLDELPRDAPVNLYFQDGKRLVRKIEKLS